MTSKEIILANLNHTGAPRPGMTFDRGRINDFCMEGVGQGVAYEPRRWTEGPIEYYDDAWGNIWQRMIDGSVKGEIFQAAIEDWSQLDDLEAPSFDIEKGAAQLRRTFEADGEDRFHVAAVGGWIFDNARYLRKMEVYFLDMAMHPEELHRLHALVGAFYEKRIHAAGRGGADAMMIGEDLGTQKGLLFSPAMFREFFKDQYTRLVGLAHGYGMRVLMHSCGYNAELIDDLLDVGIDCFQFDQPAVYDMEWLAGRLRERGASLWSPIDIQKVLPTGDRAFIEAETERMCEIFDGMLIVKNYPDLPGIGVKNEWDDWAYNAVCRRYGLPEVEPDTAD
jgi:uroporphyrinogen decarboxylase